MKKWYMVAIFFMGSPSLRYTCCASTQAERVGVTSATASSVPESGASNTTTNTSSLNPATSAALAEIEDIESPHVAAYLERAQLYRSQNKNAQAIALYQQALETNPHSVELIYNLGVSYQEERNARAAIACFEKVIAIKPDYAPAYANLGVSYYKNNQLPDALTTLTKAVQYDPNATLAELYLGLCYARNAEYEKALELFRDVQKQEPDNFKAYHYAGTALKKMGKTELALEQFLKAHELNNQHIKNLFEIGNAYNMLSQNQQALEMYLKVLAQNPAMYAALYNIGYTLKKEGYYEQAIPIYQRAIDIKPDYALAHCGLAAALLTMGDFERGLQEYEWRWKTSPEKRKSTTQPVWHGCCLAKKKLYIYAEQGLGDTLQCVRYLKNLKDQGATIIFETQPPLIDLLKLCPYIDHLITPADPVPAYDYQIPLMSIPLITKTTVDTIPADIPYLFADPKLVQEWGEKLAHTNNSDRTTSSDHAKSSRFNTRSPSSSDASTSVDLNTRGGSSHIKTETPRISFNVGICWHGNSHYTRPALQIAAQEKAIPLATFEPLAHLPGVHLYSLQCVDGTHELDAINFTVHAFDASFDQEHGRFMDTAAVMQNLDLVITGDTSIAHLAGALGIRTWLLLPNPADWRWLRKRTDSPWYPTMRIFRQKAHGDWASVMRSVEKALKKIVTQEK
jgi:tetratricopeptide (TPR) repeat protein